MRGSVEKFLQKHRRQLIPYGALAVAIVFVYHLLSDGDFSFLLTLGALLKLFGFSLVCYTILMENDSGGVSLKTLECYAIVFVCRLCSVMYHPGYLPYDSSGDWFYQFVLWAALAVVAATAFLTGVKLKTTYEHQFDTFGALAQVPSQFGIVVLVGPCLLLALIFHPSLNSNFLTDVLWTFALYLEAVAALPQLNLFHQRSKRSGGDVAAFTAHFVFALGAGAALHLLFWLSSHHELAGARDAGFLSGSIIGYLTVVACLVQVGLMADFLFVYLKSVKTGERMVLPGGV